MSEQSVGALGGPALRSEIERVAAAVPGTKSMDLIRPRLVRALGDRFDVRLVKVVGHAGFGKTTAIAHAVEQNKFEPQGIDVWVSVLDADTADRVINRTLVALGKEANDGDDTAAASIDEIVESVWAMAPQEVCLIFDDAHLLDDLDTQKVVWALVDALPANGHVLVTSRTDKAFAPARVNATGQVRTIDQSQLGFSDAEIAELAEHTELQTTDVDVERWPAQLALAQRGGVNEQIRYLSEEILSSMDGERIAVLATVALLGICDDHLLNALHPGALSLEDAVADLPLVHRYESGVVRLHDLWDSALAGHLNEFDTRRILLASADEFFTRGDYATALALSAKAKDDQGVRRAGLLQAARPLLGQQREELAHCCAALNTRDLPVLLRTFEALEIWCRMGMAPARTSFEDALSLAREHQDVELEATIVHRLEQSSGDGQYESLPLIMRSVEQLRHETSSRARLTVLHFDISAAIGAGNPDEAKLLIADLPEVAGPVANHYASMFLTDLGCPELIGGSPDDPVREGTEVFWALASWLRGDATPEEALELAQPLLAQLPQRATTTSQSTFGVLTVIAAAAGAKDQAERFVAATTTTTQHEIGTNMAAFASVARAAFSLVWGTEQEAADHLRDATAISPIGDWLYRCYLTMLPSVYVLCPDLRDKLASFTFGPNLDTARSYGQAVVTLRESGRTAAMNDIDWTNTNLLRAHVSPPHLAELAVAGSAENILAARQLVAALPNTAELLIAVADRHRGKVQKEAKRLLQEFPRRPSTSLRLCLLGDVSLTRSGVPVIDPDWSRARVQELLAWFAIHKSGSRDRIGEALWPDLDSEAAQNNLRVHLSYLNRVLEPDRPKGVPPWFIRSDGDRIALVGEGIATDFSEVNAAHREAIAARASGYPQVALASYNKIIDLWKGELLSGLGDPEWAMFERFELQNAASTACVRKGELNLARGEPEVAVEASRLALRIDPLSQRAGRLFVQGLRGTGDMSGSRRAAREFLERLNNHNEPLDPETERLLES